MDIGTESEYESTSRIQHVPVPSSASAPKAIFAVMRPTQSHPGKTAWLRVSGASPPVIGPGP